MKVTLDTLFQQPFIKSLQESGGEIFAVGGCVRDYLMNKEVKDIDIVVCKLTHTQILSILQPHASYIDVVGQSFGVIKFKDNLTNTEFDIALPRKDFKLTDVKGHKGIEAVTDPNMSIEEDLGRRDFTINSIALSSVWEYIDPFSGITDIRKELIRATSINAFMEDPLRMVRAIQFAARFKFDIESKTEDLIKINAHLIKEIAAERILSEIDKVYEKGGSMRYCLNLLNNYELREHYLPGSIATGTAPIHSLPEFFYLFIPGGNKAEVYKEVLKGSSYVYNQLKALEYLMDNIRSRKIKTSTDYRLLFKEVTKIAKGKLDQVGFFVTLAPELLYEVRKFYSKYPVDNKSLDLSGDEVKQYKGVEGKEVGEVLDKLYKAVVSDLIENKKEQLIEYLWQI